MAHTMRFSAGKDILSAAQRLLAVTQKRIRREIEARPRLLAIRQLLLQAQNTPEERLAAQHLLLHCSDPRRLRLLPATGDPALEDLNRAVMAEVDARFSLELRTEMIMCQAATALVTSFARKMRLVQRYLPEVEGGRLLQQYMQVGFLVEFESLLSAWGDEYHMIRDFYAAVRSLARFRIRLLPPLPPDVEEVHHHERHRDRDRPRNGRAGEWAGATAEAAPITDGRQVRGTDDWRAGNGGAIRLRREGPFIVIEMRLWPMRPLKGEQRQRVLRESFGLGIGQGQGGEVGAGERDPLGGGGVMGGGP